MKILFVFITFVPVLNGFLKIHESMKADQHGHHSDIRRTSHVMTSSPDDADSEMEEDGMGVRISPPGRRKPKKLGLNG